VKDLSDRAVVDVALNEADRFVKLERNGPHEHQLARRRNVDQVPALLRGRRERFFDEAMLVGLETAAPIL